MLNTRLAGAIVGVFLTATLLLHLLSVGQTKTPYANVDTSRKLWEGRNQLNQLDDNVFLLGVGKADITG